MSRKQSILIVILALAALCVSAAALAVALKNPAAAPKAESAGEPARDVQFVLYLGTNDKDTVEPVFPPEEAKARLEDILIQRFGGYTITDASGGWIGDDGTAYQEYTLVIYLSDTTPDDVHALCDELIEVYRQSSVLIQINETTTEFYSGAN